MTSPLQDLCTGPEQLVPGVLRGYRTWRLNGFGQLTSTAQHYTWGPTAGALCSRGGPCGCGNSQCVFTQASGNGHEAPSVDCGCGLYGWYAPDDSRIVPSHVFGCIEVSGRVLLGTHGFRAERARILGLVTIPKGTPRAWRDYRAAGARFFDSREQLLEQFPPDDVSALVDHTCTPECAASEDSPAAVLAQVAQAMYGAGAAQVFQYAAGGWMPAPPAPPPAPAQTPPPPTPLPPPGSFATPLGPLTPQDAALQARQQRNTGPRPRRRWGRWL